MRNKRGTLALLLAVCLLLSACGGGLKAAAMRLRKTAGEVWITDEKQKDVPLAEDLGLYSGYRVDTWEESYAWIDLDEVKLTKMDADSRVEVVKDGKDLEILVKSGSIFFNVTEPLAEDETMTIRTADLLVGIRGTCGWVDAEKKQAALLEGRVLCEAENGEKAKLSAGEKVTLEEDGSLTVTPLTAQDIPEFVREEIETEKELAKWLEVTGDPEPTAPEEGEAQDDSGHPENPQPEEPEPAPEEMPWREAYVALLASVRAQNTGSDEEDAIEYHLYDIDKNGVPELMIEYGRYEACRHASIYTCSDGGVVNLTDDGGDSFMGMSHTYFYTWPDGNGVVLYGGHMGSAWASRLQLENNELVGVGLIDEYIEDFETQQYTDIQTVAPGTEGLESYQISEDDPILNY